MAAGRYDLPDLEQGAQFLFEGDFFDDADETVEHDFTAHDGIFIVRRREDDDAPEITRATFDDGRMSSPALGQLRVEIPGTATALFPAGCWFYWLATWPDGVPADAFYWLKGRITVKAGAGV